MNYLNYILIFLISFFSYLTFLYGKNFTKIKKLRPIKTQKSELINKDGEARIYLTFKYQEQEINKELTVDSKFLEALNQANSQNKRIKLMKLLPNTDYIYFDGKEITLANNQHFWFFFFLTFSIIFIIIFIAKNLFF